MDPKHNDKFAAKHGPDARPDPEIADALAERAQEKSLPCAVAFSIAESLDKTPALLGKTADLLGYRLTKCQLGLFGYAPEKKIVRPKAPEDPALADAILQTAKDGRLSCRKAWEIAERFGARRMTVSGACEDFGLKIKPCQLGAF